MEKSELTKLLSKPKNYYSQNLKNKYGFFQFKKPVILFGAAQMGGIYLDLCKRNKIEVLAFADNNQAKVGKKIRSKNIISVSELVKFPKATQIIITSIYDEEILSQLRNIGFIHIWPHSFFSTLYPQKFNNLYWQNSLDDIYMNKDKILACFDLFKDKLSKKTFLELIKYRLFLKRRFIKKIRQPKEKEYFDKDIMNLTKNEIFIDGGAYDGDTIKIFRRITKNNYSAIYAFEPDRHLFQKLKQYVERLNDKRIKIYSQGLGEKEANLKFSNDATLGSRITKKGHLTIQVVPLKRVINKATFIKLDIEGAEKEALRGAKKIITKNKPKLAICVYHKSTDLWKIPLLLKRYVSGYTFYLRHYSPFLYGTVYYAV